MHSQFEHWRFMIHVLFEPGVNDKLKADFNAEILIVEPRLKMQ